MIKPKGSMRARKSAPDFGSKPASTRPPSSGGIGTRLKTIKNTLDRKSTRLNSSHGYNLVCRLLLEKKNTPVSRLRRALGGLAERPGVRRRELRRVAEDRRLGVPRSVQRLAARAEAAVQSVAGRGD